MVITPRVSRDSRSTVVGLSTSYEYVALYTSHVALRSGYLSDGLPGVEWSTVDVDLVGVLVSIYRGKAHTNRHESRLDS